jgi:hypothetical protein
MRMALAVVVMWLVVAPGNGATIRQELPPVSGLVWTKPDQFWFRKTIQAGHLWLNVDAQHGAKEPLFDHQRLAIELGIRTGNEYTPHGLPLAEPAAQFVVKYDGANAYIQEGAMAIEFILNGSVWRCDLQIKWNWNLVPPTDYECQSRRPATAAATTAQTPAAVAARQSPDGRWEALIENHNVVVRPVSGGAAARKTTDGTAAFAYQTGSIHWAADSQSVSAYRVHEQVWLSPSVSGNVKAHVQRGTLALR